MIPFWEVVNNGEDGKSPPKLVARFFQEEDARQMVFDASPWLLSLEGPHKVFSSLSEYAEYEPEAVRARILKKLTREEKDFLGLKD